MIDRRDAGGREFRFSRMRKFLASTLREVTNLSGTRTTTPQLHLSQ